MTMLPFREQNTILLYKQSIIVTEILVKLHRRPEEGAGGEVK